MHIRSACSQPSHLRSIVDQDGAVILDLDHGEFFSLNPVAHSIWTRLQAGEMPDAIALALARETGADLDRVLADMNEFLLDLKSKHLIRASDKSAAEREISQ